MRRGEGQREGESMSKEEGQREGGRECEQGRGAEGGSMSRGDGQREGETIPRRLHTQHRAQLGAASHNPGITT